MASVDSILSLPVDDIEPTESEMRVVDSLFKKQRKTFMTLFEGSQDILVVGGIFFVFSLPQVNDILEKLIPSTKESVWMKLFIKTLLVMLAYFLLKNFHLSRK